MKLIVVVLAMCLLSTGAAFSQLIDADIDKIRLIVKEEIRASEARMEKRIADSEARMEKHISQEIATANTTIRAMGKRLDQASILIIVLVAVLAAVIVVPQILAAVQQRSRNEKIEANQKQIEALQQELATYRKERQNV